MDNFPRFIVDDRIQEDHLLPFVQISAQFLIDQLNSIAFLENFRQTLVKIQESRLDVIRKKLAAPAELTRVEKDGGGVSLKDRYRQIQTRIVKLLTIQQNEQYVLRLQQDLHAAIVDPENGIESLIGESRLGVRKELYTIMYSIGRGYTPFLNTYANYMITGDPGSGKNKVAGVLAFFYWKVGLIGQSEPRIVTRTDLVGSYVGDTEIRTRRLLVDSLDGVLVIDEAYSLFKEESGKDFGIEAINELVGFLDKNVEFSLVCTLGYRDRMVKNFLGANPGLDRRFPNKIHLDSYTSNDLVLILRKFTDLKESPPIVELYGYFIQSLITLFNNQSGDMQNLSATIKRNFFLGTGNFPEKYIVSKSFQEFLLSKGKTLYFKNGVDNNVSSPR
jgi:hypothetical protein